MENLRLFSTAASELRKQDIVRFPTGCNSLDSLLSGGIEAGVITQVYGGPGVGKTQLCHTLCVMLPSDYGAIYIDTEGSFRPERIKEIANARGLHPKQILQKILVTKPLDSRQQESCIVAACSKIDAENKIKLLIVDSIIYHYRAECAGRSKLPEKIQRLNKYMHLLLKTASSNAVAVVVTNEVICRRNLQPLLEVMLCHTRVSIKALMILSIALIATLFAAGPIVLDHQAFTAYHRSA